LPDTSQQKILLLLGPKRSGKGTIARVLRAMIGMANTVSPTLGSLSLNFGLQPLLHKTLAIISDARLSRRTDAAVVAERLLSISGEDEQTVDRKFLPSLTLHLPVRFMILTNELPKLNDPSGALAGRMVLLRLTRSFYGQEDTKLTDTLLQELSGILLWAIEGWKRLRKRGHFEQPESSKRVIEQFEDLSSPINAFLRDCCETGKDFEVPCAELFKRWKGWCEPLGHKAGSDQTFGRDLRAAVADIDTRQIHTTAMRWRVYTGIRLRQTAEGSDENERSDP
jgi:putative DNA primase/helicase